MKCSICVISDIPGSYTNSLFRRYPFSDNPLIVNVHQATSIGVHKIKYWLDTLHAVRPSGSEILPRKILDKKKQFKSLLLVGLRLHSSNSRWKHTRHYGQPSKTDLNVSTSFGLRNCTFFIACPAETDIGHIFTRV